MTRSEIIGSLAELMTILDRFSAVMDLHRKSVKSFSGEREIVMLKLVGRQICNHA